MVDEITLDEAWETETGLLDEYIGTVQRAWFATDARYNDGNTIMLHLELATTDPDTPEVLEKFPVGGGWDSADGGKSVAHEKGKQRFNKNSIYGKIVDRITSSDGVLHDAFPVIKGRGRPTTAAIWDGLTFQFKREEFDYGGEIGKRSRVMPVKFLGENAEVPLPTAAAATTAAAAVSAPVADDVVLAKLRAAAKASDTHQAFLDAAMEVDGVTTNDALMAQLVDDGTGGFYALARG